MRVDGSWRRILGVMGASLTVAGCLAPGTLEGGTPIQMRVWSTPTTVELDAPGWIVDVSGVYLCATEPPRLPDAASDRLGWSPGGDCHHFGSYPSRDGLTLSLPLADLSEPERPVFAAQADWYILLLDLDGELVTGVVRSRFHAPRPTAPSAPS